MRPSASCSTTPNSRVFSTRLTASVPIPPAALWRATKALEVDVGERVAGDDQERAVVEEVGAVAHAAGGAEQLRLLAVDEPVAEVVADRVREVVEVRDHVVVAVAVEQVDDVRHHGPVEHRHHRLRQLERERAQARAETGCENHGLHRRGGPLADASGAAYRCPAPRRSGTRAGRR